LTQNVTLDPSTHTLYAGDFNGEPAVMMDTVTCNAQQTSGCSQPISTGVNAAFTAVHPSTHSVYFTDFFGQSVWLVNELTCNANDQSDCSSTSIAALPADDLPLGPAGIDPMTHSIYVPLIPSEEGSDNFVAVVDGSNCNGIDESGCGQTPISLSRGQYPWPGADRSHHQNGLCPERIQLTCCD
jgi:hypothetical protein